MLRRYNGICNNMAAPWLNNKNLSMMLSKTNKYQMISNHRNIYNESLNNNAYYPTIKEQPVQNIIPIPRPKSRKISTSIIEIFKNKKITIFSNMLLVSFWLIILSEIAKYNDSYVHPNPHTLSIKHKTVE